MFSNILALLFILKMAFIVLKILSKGFQIGYKDAKKVLK